PPTALASGNRYWEGTRREGASAGSLCWGRPLILPQFAFPFPWLGSSPPHPPVGRSASRLVFENHHFYIPHFRFSLDHSEY
uniref:Uncharacterized protein n=1 Tax=Equus asinus asinus TaxID=83772 RepID=A0A8C4M7J0_EQUAS